ncbi:MAG: prolipoprotein diacylglyceryl transferase, partial [Clostridia bacterium]|nr:prolipoprotein diacylglyceryl transferase [Clostridia bacterium]
MDNFLAVDRVAFRVGDFEIYWYGVIICLAIIVAVVVATMFCRARKYNTEIPLNIALVILPTGILAARFFAVIFDDSLVLSDYFNF